MNIGDVRSALKALNITGTDIVTVNLINEHYKNIIEKSNLKGNNSLEKQCYMEELHRTKQFLMDNIGSIISLLANEAKDEAKVLFEGGYLYEAKEKYDRISRMLPLGAEIVEYLSDDECIQYGICCLKAGLRIRKSNSYLFSYGYGGEWNGNEWINCQDYKAFPSAWSVIKNNISGLVSNHPLISEGLKKSCSAKKYEDYCSVHNDILKVAKYEYDNQERLLAQLYNDNNFLSNYINNTNGFFLWDDKQFYIYDDGNDNLYPIYRVSVKNNRIIMDFYKFSHFRQKKSGKIPRHAEYTVEIITDHFIQLRCTTGGIPTGYCSIAYSTPAIDYKKYMKKPKFTECPICGGKRFAGICVNFCKLHLEGNE